jgi:hypothetical protein
VWVPFDPSIPAGVDTARSSLHPRRSLTYTIQLFPPNLSAHAEQGRVSPLKVILWLFLLFLN